MNKPTQLNPDHILKLSLSVAILIASLALAYYYVVFLPSNERANLERQKQEERDADVAESAAASSSAKAEAQRQDMLTDCLADAQLNYHANWTKACQSQLSKLQLGLANCESDEAYCQKLWGSDIEQSKRKSCTLIGGSGQNVEEWLKEDKNDCYKRYN